MLSFLTLFFLLSLGRPFLEASLPNFPFVNVVYVNSGSAPPQQHLREVECDCENCRNPVILLSRWRASPCTESIEITFNEALPLFPQWREQFMGLVDARSLAESRNTEMKFSFAGASAHESSENVKLVTLHVISRVMSEAIESNLLALNQNSELIVPLRRFTAEDLKDLEIIGFLMAKALKSEIPLGYPVAEVIIEAIKTGKPYEIPTQLYHAIDPVLVRGFFKLENLTAAEREEIGLNFDGIDVNRPSILHMVEMLVQKRVVRVVAYPLLYLSLGFSRGANPIFYRRYPTQSFISDFRGNKKLTEGVLREKLNVLGPNPEIFWSAFLSLSSEEQLQILATVTKFKLLTADSFALLKERVIIWIDHSEEPQDLSFIRANECGKMLEVPNYSCPEVLKEHLLLFISKIHGKN